MYIHIKYTIIGSSFHIHVLQYHNTLKCFRTSQIHNKCTSFASSIFDLLGRYYTFQYPDQDAYQYPFAEDFNTDTLFHVSVSVKRICLFYLSLNSAYIISLSFTSKFNTFYQKCGDNNCFIIYTRLIAMIRCISGRLWI